jgi:hypothetical protein
MLFRPSQTRRRFLYTNKNTITRLISDPQKEKNIGAFFCPRGAGKKTGLSAAIPRKAPMRFPVGFPLQSLAQRQLENQFQELLNSNSWAANC